MSGGLGGGSYYPGSPGGLGGGGGGYSSGGGGGGSIIDSSAVAIITEVSGIASPDGSPNGEVIITAVPPPLGITTVDGLPVVIWPTAGKNFVLQMTTNLTSGNWMTFTNGIPFNGIPFFGLQITNGPGTAFFRLH